MCERSVRAETVADGRVRLVTLDRPERLNAFTAESYRRLTDALRNTADVGAIVLTGAGRAFSAGADLDEVRRPGGGAELGDAFDPMLEALTACEVPLIGAVNGVAVGLGMTLLLHCDLVLVDEGARMRAPFTAMGTAPEAASTLLLPERAGPQEAAWLLLSSEWIDADEAVRIGLAWRRCAAGTVVDRAVEAAAAIAAHPGAAVRATVRLLRAGRAEAVAATWRRERDEMTRLAVPSRSS